MALLIVLNYITGPASAFQPVLMELPCVSGFCFASLSVTVTHCYITRHPDTQRLEAATVCLACGALGLQLGPCSAGRLFCSCRLVPRASLSAASLPVGADRGGVPHTWVCWLKQGGGGTGPVPVLMRPCTRHGGGTMLGWEGRPHPQAVFKPLLVTYWLLCHWGHRVSGQGQGWCRRVSEGPGHSGR